MFQNITQGALGTDATIEIFIMLLWALILGMILGWMIKPSFKNFDSEKSTIWGKKSQSDDFLLIEWIGPKIQSLLIENGVKTYNDIVKEDVAWLEVILLQWGKKFAAHNPSTWPDQARLAIQSKWSELEEYQDILNSNKKRSR